MNFTMNYRETQAFPGIPFPFSFIPIEAAVDRVNVCLQEWIRPMIESVEVIRALKRLITNFWNTIVRAPVWSDPLEAVSNFKESMRGTGYYFGESALLQFLEKSDAVSIIRAH
jgi:hypothetical protein